MEYTDQHHVHFRSPHRKNHPGKAAARSNVEQPRPTLQQGEQRHTVQKVPFLQTLDVASGHQAASLIPTPNQRQISLESFALDGA